MIPPLDTSWLLHFPVFIIFVRVLYLDVAATGPACLAPKNLADIDFIVVGHLGRKSLLQLSKSPPPAHATPRAHTPLASSLTLFHGSQQGGDQVFHVCWHPPSICMKIKDQCFNGPPFTG